MGLKCSRRGAEAKGLSLFYKREILEEKYLLRGCIKREYDAQPSYGNKEN